MGKGDGPPEKGLLEGDFGLAGGEAAFEFGVAVGRHIDAVGVNALCHYIAADGFGAAQ